MKKIYGVMFAAMVGFFGLGVYQAHAMDYHWLQTLGNKTVETKQFNVEMSGKDGRMYVFQHPVIPNTVCSFIATSGGKSGMDCVKLEAGEKLQKTQ